MDSSGSAAMWVGHIGPMVAGLVSAAAGSSGGVYPRLFIGTSVLAAVVALILALTINESRPVLKEPAESVGTGGLRAALSTRSFPDVARSRGLALPHLYPGLAGFARLREELRRGGGRADRVLPRRERAPWSYSPAPRLLPDRPRIQGRRAARQGPPLRAPRPLRRRYS